MSDLTEFLLARIAEDEAWANACEGLRWEWVGDTTDTPVAPDPALDEYLYGVDSENVSLRSVETFPYGTLPGEGPRFLISTDEVLTVAAGHIARHDPARVLAECEAKRAIVRIYAVNLTCQTELEAVVRHLATVYADHPGYREEWKP